MRQAIMLVAAAAIASAAAAGDVRPRGTAGPDGRLLNHFPYPSADRGDLVRPPRSLLGKCAAIHRDMRADLEALLARARSDPSIGNAIVALSCYRSREYQAGLFNRLNPRETLADQAYQVAPPGHSEHATGYAIDFGDRSGRCKLITCFARTKVGRWLAKNAPDFGFELSFPDGNSQGVAFEPWHWRWVGRADDGPTHRAQMIFAAARERFPIQSDQAGNGMAGIELAGLCPFASDVARQVADSTHAIARLAPPPAVLAAKLIEPSAPSLGAAVNAAITSGQPQ